MFSKLDEDLINLYEENEMIVCFWFAFYEDLIIFSTTDKQKLLF